ncbi:MAG: hypothetical protein P8M68_00495 [Aquiluna sp.]|nr:hypothetical protein [Aquiluna sp.]
MVRQINPGLARLWISESARQFGAQGKILNNLTPAELRLLEYLEAGISNNQIPHLPKMASADPKTTSDLLQRLNGTLSKTSSFLPQFSETEVERRFSEIMRLYLLGVEDPAELLKARSNLKIYISCLNRTGLTIAKAMSASAIQGIFTSDHSRVQESDTLEMGYSLHRLGQQRIAAIRADEPSLKVRLHSRASTTFDLCDLAVLISTDVVQPASYQMWMARDVPHISICFTELGVEISPIVIPGATACLACVELHRMSVNANWVSIATQLSNLERDLADTAMMLFASGIAMNKSLNYLDKYLSSTVSETTRMSRTGILETLTLDSTNCGCRTE